MLYYVLKNYQLYLIFCNLILLISDYVTLIFSMRINIAEYNIFYPELEVCFEKNT